MAENKEKVTENKRSFAEMRKENFAAAMQIANDGIASLSEPEKMKGLLNLAAEMPNLSPRNLVMIQQQMPTATKTATYDQWQQQGRNVKKGEKGLTILAPQPRKEGQTKIYFQPMKTFDISQTFGTSPAPKPQIKTDQLLAIMQQATGLTLKDADKQHPSGSVVSRTNTVFVDKNLADGDKLNALIGAAARVASHDQAPSQEVYQARAQAIAYVIGQHFGLDTKDLPTNAIENWAQQGQTPKDMGATLKSVTTAARTIINNSEMQLDRIRDMELSVPTSEVKQEAPAKTTKAKAAPEVKQEAPAKTTKAKAASAKQNKAPKAKASTKKKAGVER